ncbi:hypothetical protein BJY52DRAFT_1316996 [Lactarius psammicola]|nr:hypothetical protein BJY52DRAFT_1316996 [Lactarius psammicola]
MIPCQRFDSSTRTTHAPMILGLGSVDPIVSDNAQTTCADPTGVDANRFPSSGIPSSGDRYESPHSTLEDKELLDPASNEKGMLDSSALYPPRNVSHRSLETQNGCLGGPRDDPQVSLEPIKRRSTVPISKSTTSSKQPRRGRTGRYSCDVCGDTFAQLQGARRHYREKHEPRHCPHCHAFRWGAIATGDQTIPHVPLSEITSGRRHFGDNRCPTTLSPPAQSRPSPASPPLDSHVDTLDTNGEDARAGARRAMVAVLPRRYRTRDSGAVTAHEVSRAPTETEISN